MMASFIFGLTCGKAYCSSWSFWSLLPNTHVYMALHTPSGLSGSTTKLKPPSQCGDAFACSARRIDTSILASCAPKQVNSAGLPSTSRCTNVASIKWLLRTRRSNGKMCTWEGNNIHPNHLDRPRMGNCGSPRPTNRRGSACKNNRHWHQAPTTP